VDRYEHFTALRGMTAPRPKHAQPCLLAALRWGHGVQWIVFALVAAGAIAAASTVGSKPPNAAARVPAAGAPASPRTVVTLSGVPVSTFGSSSAKARGAATGSPSRPAGGAAELAAVSLLAADGIPVTALSAYQRAAAAAAASCGLPWPLLAAIGRVESDHGRFAGAVLHADGVSTPRIIGIPLNGKGTALIRDTDHGRLDGDRVYDRAVGPMQFIPSTWVGYGVDGNGDGAADPFNVFDAARAAADYLCAAGGDLTTLAGQTRAVLAYNHDGTYLAEVLALERAYASGVPGVTIPLIPPARDLPRVPIPPLPPVNPGKPPAIGTPRTSAPGSSSGSGSTPAPGSTAPGSTAPGSTAPGSTPPDSSTAGTTSPGTTSPGTTSPGTTSTASDATTTACPSPTATASPTSSGPTATDTSPATTATDTSPAATPSCPATAASTAVSPGSGPASSVTVRGSTTAS
jgi:membrane-bound lytic murein transglycosylase B